MKKRIWNNSALRAVFGLMLALVLVAVLPQQAFAETVTVDLSWGDVKVEDSVVYHYVPSGMYTSFTTTAHDGDVVIVDKNE